VLVLIIMTVTNIVLLIHAKIHTNAVLVDAIKLIQPISMGRGVKVFGVPQTQVPMASLIIGEGVPVRKNKILRKNILFDQCEFKTEVVTCVASIDSGILAGPSMSNVEQHVKCF
jgi:hypothetical protein